METLNDTNRQKRYVVLTAYPSIHNHEIACFIHPILEHDDIPVLCIVIADEHCIPSTVEQWISSQSVVISRQGLKVDFLTIENSNWFDTLQKTVRPNDIIVCHEEQTILDDSFKFVPFAAFLTDHLPASVRTMSFSTDPMPPAGKTRIPEGLALLGFLTILTVSTWLQINLEQFLPGSIAKVSVMLALCVEVGAIWTWYRFTYK